MQHKVPKTMRSLKLPLLCSALGLGLGLVGCEDDTGIVEVEARMTIDPPVVDFGPVQVGTTETIDVFIQNTGTANLILSGISKGDPFDESFTFDIDRMTLLPNAIAVLTINFDPEELGERSAKLIVRAQNDEVEDQEIDILGEGVTTTLEVDPQNVDFGNVVINTTKEITVTLTNNSGVDAPDRVPGGHRRAGLRQQPRQPGAILHPSSRSPGGPRWDLCAGGG